MLSLKHVTKKYKFGKKEVCALNDVSVDFPAHGMVFILGKSGSGKSTLLNVAGGLDCPDSGEISVGEQNGENFYNSDDDTYRNGYVGFVFQDYNLLNDFDVGYNIALALRLRGRKDTKRDVANVLERVGLCGYEKRKIATLSGGEKQRVAIARALVKDPKIILADEPTGALDSENGSQTLDLLKSLSADRLVIVVSHDRDFAAAYGDRIIELSDGKIISDNTLSAVQTCVKDGTAVCGNGYCKPCLPLASATQIGIGYLKVKPIRLIISIVTAIAAFALLGTLFSMIKYDKNYTIATAMEASSYSAVQLVEHVNAKIIDKGKEIDNDFSTYTGKTEMSTLNNSETGLDFAGVFALSKNRKMYYNDYCSIPVSEFPNDLYYGQPCLQGLSDCGKDYADRHFDLMAGRYPEKWNEVALTHYTYETFCKYGFKSEGVNTEVNSPHDLLGKRIFIKPETEGYYLTIVGIYDVGKIPEKFDILKTIKADAPDSVKMPYYDISQALNECYLYSGFYRIGFVSDRFFDIIDLRIREAGRYEPFIEAEFFSELQPSGISKYSEWQKFAAFDELADFDGVKVYSSVDGSEMTDSYFGSFSDKECFLSLRHLAAFAKKLNYSVCGTGTYGEAHPEFAEAYSRISISAEDIKGETTLLHSDIETIIRALNSENPEYRTARGQQSVSVPGANDRKILQYSLSVTGFADDRAINAFDNNEDYPVMVFTRDFIKSCQKNEHIFGESEPFIGKSYITKYVKPDDAVYKYVIAPTPEITREMMYFVLAQGEPNNNDSMFLMVNDVYKKSDDIGMRINDFKPVFTIVGIVLTILSALLYFGFIAVSVSSKTKETGILRSMGARKKDVFLIFALESLFIFLLCFLFSVVGSAVACSILDGVFLEIYSSRLAVFSVMNFNIFNILFVFGISFAVCTLSTVIPVVSAVRKSPVELIRSN